ncbi:hypothetical protein GB937_008030, partial [Aspergillus fischeri]
MILEVPSGWYHGSVGYGSLLEIGTTNL